MTACKNFAKGGKAGRVITAALVATLSVGAPVVALATTGAEGGIETLATRPDLFENYDVVYENGENGASFAYTGKAQGLVPDYVKYELDGQTIDKADVYLGKGAGGYNSADAHGKAYYTYVMINDNASTITNSRVGDISKVKYVNSKGKQVALKGTEMLNAGASTMPTDAGEYAVVVALLSEDGRTWTPIAVADTFTITSSSLADAVIYENDDQTDTEFNYVPESGKNTSDSVLGRMNVAIDGEKLEKDEDYTLSLKKADGSSVSDPLTPGDEYIVTIEGDNNFDGSAKDIKFKYMPFDLSEASIEAKTLGNGEDGALSAATVASLINKIAGISSVDTTEMSISLVKDPNGRLYVQNPAAEGAYTYKISATNADSPEARVVGEATFTVFYGKIQPSVKYDGKDTATLGTQVIDLSDTDGARFDASKFSVKYTVDGKETTLSADDYSVVCRDEKGKVVDASNINSVPGKYTVTVSVADEFEDGYVSGSFVFNFETKREVVQATDVFMIDEDGKNVESNATPTYDGTDLLKNYTFKVVCAGKTLVAGTDYEITVENDEKDVVDEVVNAGVYTVTIKGKTYDGTATFTITVGKRALTVAEPNFDIVDSKDSKNSYFVYTGEEIVPTFTFSDAEGNEFVLSEDEFDVAYTKDSKKSDVKDTGSYVASITPTKDCKNYSFGTLTANLKVSDDLIFADVPNDAWYTQAILDAKNLEYMSGYAGTKLFGPNESLTRAQAVVVLFNMASGSNVNLFPGASYDKDKVYTTGFSDVDADGSNAWATYAIKWAKDTGITTGYGDGTFGVNDKISRAQFATMLARYAELVNRYEAVDNADELLGAYNDGDAVDDWFKDSVAWAVQNDIMGKDVTELNPNGTIERAQVAAMAVRFQPEAL